MKPVLLFSSFLFFLGFSGWSVAVKMKLFTQLDFNFTVKLQDHVAPALDTYFSLIGLIGSVAIMTLLLIATYVHYKWGIIIVFLGYAAGLGIELLGKLFLQHPAPPHLFFRNDPGFTIPDSYIHSLHSYPSGHAFRMTFVSIIWLAMLYFYIKSPALRALIFVITLAACSAMMVVKVTLGEHWMSDVVGGFLLGVSSSLACIALTLFSGRIAGDHARIY